MYYFFQIFRFFRVKNKYYEFVYHWHYLCFIYFIRCQTSWRVFWTPRNLPCSSLRLVYELFLPGEKVFFSIWQKILFTTDKNSYTYKRRNLFPRNIFYPEIYRFFFWINDFYNPSPFTNRSPKIIQTHRWVLQFHHINHQKLCSPRTKPSSNCLQQHNSPLKIKNCLPSNL